MNVVFTHAYFMYDDPKEQGINKPYPPLGILYLSSWLEQNGYDNDVYDTTFFSATDQQQFLLEKKPDVIAIYTNLVTKIEVVKLMKFIRQESSLAHSLIVLGGPDVTYNIENYMAAGAHLLVVGEGEQTMLEIVQAVDRGLAPQFGHINGLVYKDENGEIVRTPKRAHLRHVDELMMPNRKKIDLNLYLDTWKKYHGSSSLTVSTQRGCPYTCRWCSTAVYGQSYRRRKPSLVAEELKGLQENYQPDQIWFVDDVFTVSHKWLTELRDELKALNVCIPFECITRAERLSPEIISILKECGCFRIWIGAESGSQRILDAMDRRVDANQVADMIIEARRQGVESGTFIMLGYPGETEADIHLTLNYLKRANPDLFTITVAYPIKGTGLYEDVKNDLIYDLDWFTTTDRDNDFKRAYCRRYYDFAVRWVVNGVNLHKEKERGNRLSWTSIKYASKGGVARIGMLWNRMFKSKANIKSDIYLQDEVA